MFSWLKRHFIPHKGNDYKPHFLASHNTRHLLAMLLMTELLLFILPTVRFNSVYDTFNLSAVLPAVLTNLTNQERSQNNLGELKENQLLDQVAQMKAQDMASKGYFAHISPEGLTPWYFFDKVGYNYQFAGENLAINFTDSKDVTEAWMNSPTHRDNILKGAYTEVGTGVAEGMYQGQRAIFVAQEYGKPAPIVSVAPIPQSNYVSLPGSSKKITSPSNPLRNENLLASSVPKTTEVLGASQPVPAATFIQTAAASPKQTVNAVLYVVLAIVLIALFLEITVKFEEHHPDLIANGMLLVVVIFGIYLGNNFFANKNLKTSFTSFDASHVSTN